ncbi:glycosyltransferase [Pseudomonas sp. UL073]|uniref:Glycosyltransferase n=1 Tax=Zestomonas insulae TaxID=2809017 RepID=A0ABS2IEJ4_9GAMM|nr:glycosyltransferase [Pseudomonas insulae]MBM7061185.1 glycosyltransferase [Pseudomonas insulae]
MPKVLQLMVQAGESTAKVGDLIASELKDFQFINCYLHAGRQGEVSLNLPSFLVSGVFRYLAALWIYLRLRHLMPEVILVHRFKCLHLGYLLSLLMRRSLIVVVHGVGDYDRGYRRRLLARALRRGGRVVCVSEYVRDYIYSVLGGSVEHVSVIPNSIDFAKVEKQCLSRFAAREQLGGLGAEGQMVIGFVGRLASVKGAPDFVEAALRLNASNVQFVIMGDGPLRPELEALVRDKGNPGNVRFCGFVRDAFTLVGALDLLVMPSRSEGFPLALLEAVASEVPVVASDIAVFREILGDSPFLYKAGDLEALVSRLEACIGLFHEQSLADAGLNIATQIKADYPYAGFIAGYEKLIRSVCR